MILNISYTAFFDFFQYDTVEFLPFSHPLHPFSNPYYPFWIQFLYPIWIINVLMISCYFISGCLTSCFLICYYMPCIIVLHLKERFFHQDSKV